MKVDIHARLASIENLLQRILEELAHMPVRPPMPPLLTPAQVAEILQVSIGTARDLMREAPAIWAGNQLRWTQEKLERFLRAGGSKRHTLRDDSFVQPRPRQNRVDDPLLRPIQPRRRKHAEADPLLKPIKPRFRRNDGREPDYHRPTQPRTKPKKP